MKVKWIISARDEAAYRSFFERYKKCPFVRKRIRNNLKRGRVRISKAAFWKALIGALVTSQQRSGKGSPARKFLRSKSELLNIEYCLGAKNLAKVARLALGEHGVWRSRIIAPQVAAAGDWLKKGNWPKVRAQLRTIQAHTTGEKERVVARFLQEQFHGIGPKQSRNLIQSLGLSRYEIPLDSRFIKVLRTLSFPIQVNPQILADEGFYCFIENGIQLLLARIGVYPCVFDACVFASQEKDSWQPPSSGGDGAS